MGTKVLKFGGSSVADAIQLAKLKAIVEADADNRFVVVSAPGKRFPGDNKITDLLYMCKQQADMGIPYEQLLQVIGDRYIAVAHNLNTDCDIDAKLAEIAARLREGCSEDYIASRGEYLSAVLVSAYLGWDFVDTAELILFDDRGRLLAEETNEALATELAKHERAVIPGFYGSTASTGEVKVFSRGGSDVTGSLVARAVNADIYENWTDVSGLLMADPRIVDRPRPIDRISYIELRELSYMGATVLHEDAVFPAREANIPINIRNTNAPDDPGTIIDPEAGQRAAADGSSDGKVISGIAGGKDFTVIAVYKNMMNKEQGFVRRALMILDDLDISFDHIPTGIDTFSVVIENKELDGKLGSVVEEFERQLSPDEITVHDDISLIAVVGYGMVGRVGTAARILTAVADAGINVRMLNQGSGEVNMIIGVDAADFEKATRAIYEAFE